MPSVHLAKWNKASILHWLRLSLSFYYGYSAIHLKTSKDGNISFPRKTGWQTACRLSLLLFSCLSFQKNQWVSLSYIRFYTNHFLQKRMSRQFQFWTGKWSNFVRRGVYWFLLVVATLLLMPPMPLVFLIGLLTVLQVLSMPGSPGQFVCCVLQWQHCSPR